jgi:drug/metabolite transporter (DMT)-like permease
VPRTALTREGSRPQAFAPLDWLLFAGLALTMGSSFFLIAVGIEAFPPALVALLRLAFGAVALAPIPAARRPVQRRDRPRIALLGLVWMGAPLVLFPMAEQRVASSVAGMVNAAVPLFAAAVAAVLLRRAPGPMQRAGLAVGLVGVVLLSAGSGTSGTHVTGIALLVAAVACYGVAVNLAVPLQQRYGGLPVILRAEIAGGTIVAPLALADLPSAGFSWTALAAVAALGALGTGLAFAAMATLVGRVGATRGSAATYLFPVVALALGAGVLGEPVHGPALAGAALVLVGALLVSRPEARPRQPSRMRSASGWDRPLRSMTSWRSSPAK